MQKPVNPDFIYHVDITTPRAVFLSPESLLFRLSNEQYILHNNPDWLSVRL